MFEHFLCKDLRSMVQRTRKGGECFMVNVIAFHFFLLPKTNGKKKSSSSTARPMSYPSQIVPSKKFSQRHVGLVPEIRFVGRIFNGGCERNLDLGNEFIVHNCCG